MAGSRADPVGAFLRDLRVNGLENPLAVDTSRPVFGWRMESERTGARQTAYRIVISSCGMQYWDSGRVEGEMSLCISYPEDALPLEKETDYRWQLYVWDETGAELTAETFFSTGLMSRDLTAWHGAGWIGPDEICLASYTLPVFRLHFAMRIEKGGSSAGVVFGANDPRYASSIQNNYLIHGENYIAFCLNVSRISAKAEVFRKGYLPEEKEKTLIASMEIPESVITSENRYDVHEVDIAVSGNEMEYMMVDGHALETEEKHNAVLNSSFMPVTARTHLVLNPRMQVMDVPVFPRLCEIGFITDRSTRAAFTSYSVRHFGGEQGEIFGEKTGASFDIFRGLDGLTVQGGSILAEPGTLSYADPSYGSVPILRRAFRLKKKAVRARFYVSSRGIYEMHFNGKKAGNEYLAPGDMDFRQHIYYQAFDVADLLAEGENAMGAVLASGWYGDEATYSLSTFNFYGDRQSLLALLAVKYEDGETEYIGTDERWQYYGHGPVRYAGNFNGETYDARLEAAIAGWDTAAYDEGAVYTENPQKTGTVDAFSWHGAAIMDPAVCGREPEIAAKPDPGIVKVGERTAVFTARETRGTDQDTVYIYDMGVNMVGIPCIVFPKGERGRKITIRYAEVLYPRLAEDNPFYYGELGGLILTENLRGALATDRYIMKGEENETFMPLFTFHGYRYVEISGLHEPLPAENIRGIVLSSVRQTSFYESSSPLANQLFENIIRSTSGNHLSIPTDCPQRDERLGWAGDAQVYSEAAVYMADMRSMYRYYCMLQRDAQGTDGTFHLYAPSYAEIGKAFALGYTWNAAGVVIPWQTWRQYADRTVLRENYQAMRAHVLGMMEKKAEGRQYLTSHIGFLGDHLSVKDTDPSLMDNAQYYRVVRYAAMAAEELGEEKDAGLFSAYAEGLKKEWNEVFVNREHRTQAAGGTIQDTQSSYALPLMCGVFSDENVPYAHQNLREACEKTGCTMTTGFMGTGSLLPALTEGGNIDVAYSMFEQTACPSWLYPVLNGATTVWERWNSYTIENGFGGQNGMNSFNHYSLGAVASWMMEYQAGIQRGEKEGFRHFVLQPSAGGHFTFVKAAYDSVCGTIESGWTADQEFIKTYDAVVPANTKAVLYLPVKEWDEENKQCTGRKDLPEGVTWRGRQMHLGRSCDVFELVCGRYHFEMG